MKKLEMACNIPDSAVVLDWADEEEVHLFITTSNDEYQVTYVNGLWRCNCSDYHYRGTKTMRGLNHGDIVGSYCCKHILKAIMYLSSLKDGAYKTLDDYLR